MRLRSNQTGAAHLVLALAVVLVLVIGFAGYKVSTSSKAKPAATATTSTQNTDAGYKSASDIDTASTALDTEADVDTGVNPDQLDADLSALL